MKACAFLLLFAAALLTGCATASPQNDAWFGRDKAKHFLASCVISGTAAAIADNEGMDNDESFYLAFGLTLSLGAGKEAYDMKIQKTGWSWKDLAWDTLGALAGYGIVQAFD